MLDCDDDVIGCVYVYPARDDVHDARVRHGCESRVLSSTRRSEAVADWLASDWPFERPLYAPLLG